MRIKTSSLSGAALDWAVAIATGIPRKEIRLPSYKGEGLWTWVKDEDGAFTGSYMTGPDLLFSRKWESGGPIIERSCIDVRFGGEEDWEASMDAQTVYATGPTPLIAAMRCYVASKLGNQQLT